MAEEEGYDQVNTMFTPEGRLRQVEYASKTAKRGSPVVAIAAKDGVVIMVHRKVSEKFRVPRIEMKLERIDDHIMVGVSGIISDGRVLIEDAQVTSQRNRVSLGLPIDIKSIVLRVSETLQSYTQFSGMRPFGVSLVLAGIDESGPHVYLTEPSGTFYGYKATAVGEGDEDLREVLRKQYKDDMTLDQAIELGKKALKDTLGKEYEASAIDGFYMTPGDSAFSRLNNGKR